MTRKLCFAHITDIHISDAEEPWGTLGSSTEELLENAVRQLNEVADLDFVIVTGDVLDLATTGEIDRFLHFMNRLTVPWHFVPGNHDGYIDPAHPEALAPHEGVSLIDPRLSEPRPDVQCAYWSREVGAGIRLIGLDSRYADSWNGVIAAEQLAWLNSELRAHHDSLILLAVHHPLHLVFERNKEPFFSNFIVDNGAEVEALLDQHPQVKIVLAGHHHTQQLLLRSGRLHVNTAALTSYPCVYRIIRMQENDQGWQTEVETHSPADGKILDAAREKADNSSIAPRFDPDDHTAWRRFSVGGEDDQTFRGIL